MVWKMTDRHGIGANGPPAHEAFSLEIENLFSLVSGSTASPVTTDDQEQALDSLLDDVRRARKDADAKRAEGKKPHLEAGKAVDSAWKPLIEKCDKAADEIKKVLTPYRTAKQAAKDEAAKKAREEAAAKEKAAQESLCKSDDLEERFAAEEQLKQADKLTKAANRADREATGLRTTWRAEITDMRSAMLAYMKREPDRFRSLVEELAARDARGTRAPVAGVLFIETKEAV